MYNYCTYLAFGRLSKYAEGGFFRTFLKYRSLSTCSRSGSANCVLRLREESNLKINSKTFIDHTRLVECRRYSGDAYNSIAASVVSEEGKTPINDANEQLLKEIEKGLSELEDLASTDIKIVPTVVTTVQGEEVKEFACSDLDSHLTTFTIPRSGNKVYELFGTPDPNQPPSDVPCHGCGANLHCKDPGIPGYLPSQAYLAVPKSHLIDCLCQRCQLLKTNQIALDVTVSIEDYSPVIKQIRKHKALIVLLVDMTDLSNSFHQTLAKVRGAARPIFVVGNKIDLIPKDKEGYLNRALESLIATSRESGFSEEDGGVRHFALISAKTGYGVEGLITKMLDEWRLKGHVFILGCANSGKSTLFNTLLASDFCKSSAREMIHRATTSIWPGTTLNLLKFPIINPKLERLQERRARLQKEGAISEYNLEKSKGIKSRPNLHSRISSTFLTNTEKALVSCGQTTGFVAPSYSYESEDGNLHDITDREGSLDFHGVKPEFYYDKVFKYWCYDTPGLINPDQIINLLNQTELLRCVPKEYVSCRTFIIKPGEAMFVSGLSRIDYLKGNDSIFYSVFSSLDVPVKVVQINEADQYHKEHFGTEELGVPIGDEERLKSIPPLAGTDFNVDGIDLQTSAADVVLSSLGWVALTIRHNESVVVRAYTPGAAGCKLRTPALLPYAINLKGRRFRGTNRYRTPEEEEEDRQRKAQKFQKE